MKVKKLLALLLSAILVFSCTACTTEMIIELNIPENTGSAPTPAPTPTPTPTPTPAPTPAPTPDSGASETPSQSAPSETPSESTEATTAGAQNTPAPSTGAPQTTAEILAYYNNAVNNVKKNAKSVTRNYEDYQHNPEKLELPSLLKSAGEGLIGSFLKKNETPETYEGADAIKGGFPIPGEDYTSKLTEAQIKSATCTDNGSEYEITIVAVTEKNPTYGQGVSAGFEIIKTEDVMDAASFIVKSFETEYYDCTAKCKVDKATGNITWINFSTPIVMDVASSIGINATVGMTFVKDFTITY